MNRHISNLIIILFLGVVVVMVGCGGGGGGDTGGVVPGGINSTPTNVPANTPTSTPTQTPTTVPTSTPTQNPTTAPTSIPTPVYDPNNVDTYPAPSTGKCNVKVTTSQFISGTLTRIGNVSFELILLDGSGAETSTKYSETTDANGLKAMLNIPAGKYRAKVPAWGINRIEDWRNSQSYIEGFLKI